MSTPGPQDTIDLRAILRKLMAHWWLFVITVLLAVGGAVAYIKTTPKSYAVEGVLLMSEKKRKSFGSSDQEFLKGTSYLRQSGELDDQISQLMSYTNVERTIRRLGFEVSYLEERNFLLSESYVYKPFIVKPDSTLQVHGLKVEVVPDTVSRTYRVICKAKNVPLYDFKAQKASDGFVPKLEVDSVVKMGEPFRSDFLKFSIDFPKDRTYRKDTRYFFILNTLDGLTTAYRNKTSALPQSDESNIVLLTTSGEVVQKEKDFINMLMRTYIEVEQDKQNKKGLATIEFIEAQVGESSQKLSAAQQNLTAAQAGGMVGSTGDASQSISNEMYRMQAEETRIKGQLMSLQNLISVMSTESGGTPNTVAASGIDAPSLNAVLEQYNQNVTELRSKELQERIASAPTIALRRKVQTQREQIVQSAQALVSQTQNMLAEVQGRIGQLRGQLYALPGATARINIATQKYQLTEELNNYLMEKLYEAQIAVNSDQVDKYVVDEARQLGLGPVSPNKKVVLGGALFLGLLLPVIFVLLKDLFNDRIADLDEVKRLTGLPVLAMIPGSKRKRVSPDDPKSLLAESFRTARINLQYLNPDMDRRVVGVTSSTSGEGKTFCAVNLASVMAMSGKRTLILDADMRRPKLAATLELPEGDGLSTYLIGECPLEQLIRRTDIPGLDAITAGPIPPNPLELIESGRMAELMRILRGRYDHVVVDASPMGLVSEFKVLIQHLDVTLYVVRQGYTRRGMLRPLAETVREGKLQHVDIVLNDVKAAEGYGYYTT
ncbi:MAG: polysaccharide biosynthesis tyrosine autokinase [Flavobacteriales bacterium]|nr:polysaccharide biosynthesis tyrosine autokinase [Flavobacteriales bacterium]